jgi:YVTN family beta-propeller protein
MTPTRRLAASLLGATCLAAASANAASTLPLPSGQMITPTASPGAVFKTMNPGLADIPTYKAGQAVNTALSPDGKTLLVVTSGYNLLNYPSGPNAGNNEPADSTEYVFIYNVAGSHEGNPSLLQVLQVPNTFIGLAWAPSGGSFYVAGGVSDAVYVYSGTPGSFALSATIPLGHPDYGNAFNGTPYAALGALLGNGIGFEEEASAAGLALTPDGTMLVVSNVYNDSISLISTATNAVLWEYDLRPYKNTPALAGTAGGENPISVVLKGTAATGYTAYVSSLRDREIDVVPIAATAPAAGTIIRIPLPGTPIRALLSADQTRLYVAQDNSDNVAVIDTTANAVLEEIDAITPPGTVALPERYTGAAPNSLALSPDGTTLYVTQGGANAVAVISLAGPAPHVISGLIPTGWYPHSVSLSADGSTMYVVNGKSDPGKDPQYENNAANQYILQLEAAGLLTVPVPNAATLATLTAQVVANNGYTITESRSDAAIMAGLRAKIQHVIYIIKENRTFDQVLGDLRNGSAGEPSLTMYGSRITPNFHAIAHNFVTLDNFFCSGEVSGNGWSWSTQGRETDFGVTTIPMNYANRGSSNDSEGLNRDVNIGFGSLSNRIAGYPLIGGSTSLYAVIASALPGSYTNLLPGTNDDFAADGPNGTMVQHGRIWDAAIKANITLRDYGFFNDLTRYELPASLGGVGLIENPYPSTQVAWSSSPTLAPYTDIYFRGFDNSFPDTWRWEEWNREFQAYVANGQLPALSLVRFMHDHTGNFTTAAAGINTPDLQQADNDLAVGKLVQTVANSPYAGNTLIFVIEDDAQDGPDHIDAHRSTAYVVGPYVKQHAVVSVRYSTVNMLRTIEDILGLDHLSLNDAYQGPMSQVFDLTQSSWSYTATASPLLRGTGLQPLLPQSTRSQTRMLPTHDAAWWAARTKGYDWSKEDRIPADAYNHVLWEGLMPAGTPYPEIRGAKTTQPDSDDN